MTRDIRQWLAENSTQVLQQASLKLRELLYDIGLEQGDRTANGTTPGGKQTRYVQRRQNSEAGYFVRPLSLAWAMVVNDCADLWKLTLGLVQGFNAAVTSSGIAAAMPAASVAIPVKIGGMIFEEIHISEETNAALRADQEQFKLDILPHQQTMEQFYASGQYGPSSAERDIHQIAQSYHLQKNPLTGEYAPSHEYVKKLEAFFNPDGKDCSCKMQTFRDAAPIEQRNAELSDSFRSEASPPTSAGRAFIPRGMVSTAFGLTEPHPA